MRNPLDFMRIRPHQHGTYRPLTNTFGMVRMNNTRAHQGWDLESQIGTPVYAITYGEAEPLPYHQQWGHRVRLRFLHHGRAYYAFYSHLDPIFLLRGPCSVTEGTQLGLTGMTGNAGGLPHAEAHLHFGIATAENPGAGLGDYLDPGEILGYEVYSSRI